MAYEWIYDLAVTPPEEEYPWWMEWSGYTDAQGYAHYAVDNEDEECIYHIYNTSGAACSTAGWQAEVADDVHAHAHLEGYFSHNLSLYMTDIKVDAQGSVHIAYVVWESAWVDNTYTTLLKHAWLRYVTNASGSWVSEELTHYDATSTPRMRSVGLCVTGGNVYIAVAEPTATLYQRVGGVWSTVAAPYPDQSLVHLTHYGSQACVLASHYYTDPGLYLHLWNGNAWTSVQVASWSKGTHLGLVTDQAGAVQVVYWEETADPGQSYSLMHRSYTAGVLSAPKTVDTANRWINSLPPGTLWWEDQGNVYLTTDTAGGLHCTYDAYGNLPQNAADMYGDQFLRYAYCDGGAWRAETVGDYWVFDNFAIATLGGVPFIGAMTDNDSIPGALLIHPPVRGRIFLYMVAEV